VKGAWSRMVSEVILCQPIRLVVLWLFPDNYTSIENWDVASFLFYNKAIDSLYDITRIHLGCKKKGITQLQL